MLMLTEKEVPLRAEVQLYTPGNDVPEYVDENPIVFRAMLGGIPHRKKLYHIVDGKPVAGLEGFADGMRFSPVKVYNQGNAPTGRRYAVFENGKRMFEKVKYGRIACEVTKSPDDSEIVDSAHFPFKSLSISGIPVFESKMRRLSSYSDAELIDALEAKQEEIEQFEALRVNLDESVIRTGIQKASEAKIPLIEALARRYRGSNMTELIGLLQRFGEEYLFGIQLPDNAELVPV